MSRSIWKYEIPINDEWTELSIPNGSHLLHVDQQSDSAVCFWADVITDASLVSRRFRVYGTGHPVPVTADYVGTVQSRSMPLVWHLFEDRP